MFHNLTKDQKRAFREAATLAHRNDLKMGREDRDIYYFEARNADLPMVIGDAIVRGIIRIEDVGEAARALAADLAERLGAVLEHVPSAAHDPHDPNAVVSISAILGRIDSLDDEEKLYVNRRTGEVRVLNDEYIPDEDLDLDLDADDDDDESEPDWLAPYRAEAHRLSLLDADWLQVLTGHEVIDKDIMVRFARRAPPAASRELLAAFSSRGSRRRFFEIIRVRGIEQEWLSYRYEYLARDVRLVLQQAGIPFRK